MYIADNVLAHHFQNVYWILGTACGGKTTAADHLSKKYGFYHYNADERVVEQKKLAIPTEQPAMCRYFESWEAYFGQPIEQYSSWLKAMNQEALSMIVVDLLKLAENQTVVFEGDIDPQFVRRVAPIHRVAYLYATEPVVEKAYFDRKDKDDMYQLIKTLPNSQAIMDKIYQICVKSGLDGLAQAQECGIKIFTRELSSSLAHRLAEIESHFQLT